MVQESLLQQLQHSVSKVGTLEQLLEAYEKTVLEQSDRLYEEIEEHKRTEKKLQSSNRIYHMLSECNEALVHATSENALLADICSLLVKIGGYSLACAGYVDEGVGHGGTLVAHAVHEGQCLACDENESKGGKELSCPVAAAIARESADDISLAQLYATWFDFGSPHGCTAAIALPLKGNSGVFGSLNIHTIDPDAFGCEEVQLFSELANDLSYGILSLRTAVERQQAETILRQRQRAIESSSNGIMIIDAIAADRPVIYVNPAFKHITGYDSDDVLGRDSRFLLGHDLDQLGVGEVEAAFGDCRESHAILRNYRKDGSMFWNEFSVTPVRDEHGIVTSFVGIVNDISERKLYEEQLEYQASHDGLTGLPNRNLLSDRITQILSYAGRYRKRAAVLFIDLDHFKFINDSLGHDSGDQLLKIMAERLVGCVRSIDTVARQGGDEFVIVLSDLEEDEDSAKVAHKVLHAVGKPLTIGEHELVVSCSIGISIYPKDGDSGQTLLKNADAAMYRAKGQGRNNFKFYTGELNARAVERMTMEKHLRRALERNEFFLHYQPQLDLKNGAVIGMEALLRWQSAELGFMPPANFISLAEETGLIVPIGEWVLRQACEQNKAWQDAGLPPLVMAINLSPRQFRQEGLAGTVGRILAETGLEPRWLELEVVESLIMHDVEVAAAILNALKGLGVQLSMDDFGTGYSSLSYLKRFPFDKMKIDQSFVREITSDPDSAAIVKTIIVLAHSLDLRVIAEGIETEGQLAYLRSQNCDEMQGYYFSRPVSSLDFEQLLRENRCLQVAADGCQPPERTLLLVDDEPHVIASLARMLDDEGYTILTSTSARDGFELLATNPVGVIVSDYRMPEMNGTEFLSRVKKIYPHIVRIMLSGNADFDSLGDAINRGAIHKFIAKPWDDNQLRESIKVAFRQYAAELLEDGQLA